MEKDRENERSKAGSDVILQRSSSLFSAGKHLAENDTCHHGFD
jgi:hypothetical protein